MEIRQHPLPFYAIRNVVYHCVAECLNTIRSAVCTIASFVHPCWRNFETLLNNSDLPLAFLESFYDILQNDVVEEQGKYAII